MKEFKDRQGRTWTVDVNLASLERARDLCDVDLMELAAPNQPLEQTLTMRLIDDPVLLFRVLYAILKPQIEQKGLTREDFGAAMAGDPVDAATEALLVELVNFSPNPRDRARRTAALGMVTELMDSTRTLLERRLADPRLQAALAQSLADSGDGATSSPEPSASTPEG